MKLTRRGLFGLVAGAIAGPPVAKVLPDYLTDPSEWWLNQATMLGNACAKSLEVQMASDFNNAFCGDGGRSLAEALEHARPGDMIYLFPARRDQGVRLCAPSDAHADV